MVERSCSKSEVRGAWEEPPAPEARDGGREEQPDTQGTVTSRVQEGLEELSHIQGQEGRW